MTPITVDVTIPIDEVVPETTSYLESFLMQITSIANNHNSKEPGRRRFPSLQVYLRPMHWEVGLLHQMQLEQPFKQKQMLKITRRLPTLQKLMLSLHRPGLENAANNAIALFGNLETIEGFVSEVEGHAFRRIRV